ncbi:MAG: bifunctional DNA-formamidopyrimidine glycosylase/DNA-(apurinic or apyrimidinic site) lyase [Fastidiosipilaceae bacterium]|jgi:formamidopyrimidine-DNA glycosylase
MPELPEVESIRSSLEKHILSAEVVDGRVLHSDVLVERDEFPEEVDCPSYKTDRQSDVPSRKLKRLQGRSVRGVSRRGKYLLIHLSDQQIVVGHMRMTGQLVCAPGEWFEKPEIWPPHTHVILKLRLPDGGVIALLFIDVRRFGRLEIMTRQTFHNLETGIAKLGPEPLSSNFNFEWIKNKAERHQRLSVKSFLLDQTVIAGLGNIYADEILFASGVHPLRRVSSVRNWEWEILIKATKMIIKKAIEARGTSFRDYIDAEGKQGEFQLQLQVYGRGGKDCLRCGEELQKTKVGGRTSVYCNFCQPRQGRSRQDWSERFCK